MRNRASISRRQLIGLAASFGATWAWAGRRPDGNKPVWRERRELYPEGVASGDPTSNSVLLWTRHPDTALVELIVEVASDNAFHDIVATARAPISSDSDWTCRVLVGGLKPAREYWYRFTDADGNGSRIGRTLTAPGDNDARAARFAFVSCQNVNDGAQNAYRRMIYEDERAAPEDRLGFVLHL